MRKYFLWLLVASLGLLACENKQNGHQQEVEAPDKFPVLKFKEQFYNFGEITEGDTVTHFFEFENTGTAQLLISSANASCGCTVPSYPEDPIAPGKTGKIKVTFNSKNKSGFQNKSITVYANTLPTENVIMLKGNVKEAK